MDVKQESTRSASVSELHQWEVAVLKKGYLHDLADIANGNGKANGNMPLPPRCYRHVDHVDVALSFLGVLVAVSNPQYGGFGHCSWAADWLIRPVFSRTGYVGNLRPCLRPETCYNRVRARLWVGLYPACAVGGTRLCSNSTNKGLLTFETYFS